jgi:hypothetical protein
MHAFNNAKNFPHRTHRVDAFEHGETIDDPRTARFRFEGGFKNRGAIDVAAGRRERFGWTQQKASTVRVKQPGKYRRPGKIRQAEPID